MWLDSLLRVSQAEVGMSGLHSFLEALGKNLIPSSLRFLAEFKACGHGTKMPISVLSVYWELLSAPRSCVPFLPHGFLHLQNQQRQSPAESKLDKSHAPKSLQNSRLYLWLLLK